MPALSLRGNGPLLVAHGVIFFGTDDGKLVAVRLDNGEKLWDLPLATGEGRTEIQRLDDADVGVLLDGNTLYAAAYHGNLTRSTEPAVAPAGIASSPPTRRWTSAATPLSASTRFERLGLRQEFWQRPVEAGCAGVALAERAGREQNYAVVGDLKGYVHWLDLSNGKIGRARAFFARRHPLAAAGRGQHGLCRGCRGTYRRLPRGVADPLTSTSRRRSGGGTDDAGLLPMDSSHMLPVVALVGRPNVGKSTLFNVLTRISLKISGV